MVLLEENLLGKVAAMKRAPARNHRLALGVAQAGQGLPRVQDGDRPRFGPSPGSLGCDSAEVPQEVQRSAFGGKQASSGPREGRHQ